MSSSEGRAILLAVDDTDACQLMLQWVLDSDLLLPGDKLHLLHVTMRDTAGTGSNQLPGGDYFLQVPCAECACGTPYTPFFYLNRATDESNCSV